jgi:integrase
MARRGNNEGSIAKRKDGRWQARISMPDGTRRSVYGKTRTETKEKMAEVLKEAETKARLQPGRDYRTLGDFFTVWLANVGPSVKPNTITYYRGYIRRYTEDLAPLHPSKLKAHHLQQLYAKLLEQGLSPHTVRHLHVVLHRAFDSGVRQGVFLQNVCDQVDAPRVPHKEMQYFSPEQARAFLKAAEGERLQALFVLALATGMRQGELLGLCWGDIDLDRGLIYVRHNLQRYNGAYVMGDPKTKASKRRTFISPMVVEALAAHRERQDLMRAAVKQEPQPWDLVFTTIHGRPIQNARLVHAHFEPLILKAGVPRIRFHDLRHTAATLLLEAGINPKVVSEMLGHSSVNITLSLYAHVTPAMHYTASRVMEQVLRGEINPLALPDGIE